jgi:hypothetical protein
MSESILEETYKKSGFPGLDRFWGILKDKYKKLPFKKKDLALWLDRQKVAQLHRRPTRTESTPISAPNYGFSYQIDLLDVSPYSRSNGGVHWLLLMVDIFSRRMTISPMKNKKASTALVAIKEGFEQMGAMPDIIQSDKGSEWKDSVAKFFKANDIIVKQADVGDHNSLGIIDSASRLVKNWIHKSITYNQSERYIDDLSDFVEAYNNTKHSSLGDMTPNEAKQYPHELRRYRDQKRKNTKKSKKLAIGDYVRVLKLKTAFQKGYHVKYSMTTYKIVDIVGLHYILDNGKAYRASRLLKVPESDIEPAKDVAKKARFDRRTKNLLKAEGIEQQNVVRRSTRERKPTHQLVHDKYGIIEI